MARKSKVVVEEVDLGKVEITEAKKVVSDKTRKCQAICPHCGAPQERIGHPGSKYGLSCNWCDRRSEVILG